MVPNITLNDSHRSINNNKFIFYSWNTWKLESADKDARIKELKGNLKIMSIRIKRYDCAGIWILQLDKKNLMKYVLTNSQKWLSM